MDMIELQCPGCKDPFVPNKYHPHDQKYCGKPECRRESACASRKAWRSSQADKDPTFYARESERVSKSRAWHKRHKAVLAGMDPRVVLARLRERFRWLERVVTGVAMFLGGGEWAGRDLTSFLERCARTAELDVTGDGFQDLGTGVTGDGFPAQKG